MKFHRFHGWVLMLALVWLTGCASKVFTPESQSRVRTNVEVVDGEGNQTMAPAQEYLFEQKKMGNNGSVIAKHTYQQASALNTAITATEKILSAFATADVPLSAEIVEVVTKMLSEAAAQDLQQVPLTQEFEMYWTAEANALADAIRGDQMTQQQIVEAVEDTVDRGLKALAPGGALLTAEDAAGGYYGDREAQRRHELEMEKLKSAPSEDGDEGESTEAGS